MRDTVIVIHPGALGDVLLALPAIRRLRLRHHRHELVLIARPSISRLLMGCHEIDQWISFEDQDCVGLFSTIPCLSERLQSWLKRCESAVAWLEDKGGALSDTLEQCGVTKKRIQSPFSPTLMQPHQSYRFLESIGESPTALEVNQTLQIQNEIVEQARAYLESCAIPRGQPIVLVHPGSGSPCKCMSPEQMAFLIQGLRHSGMYPLIVEGPADRDMVERVFAVGDVHPVVLQGLDLPLLAGILTQVDLYVGHDSGVTHLAASLGVKTLAIFGPTDPCRWAPLGSHVTVAQGLPCTCQSWEAVGRCANRACLDIPGDKVLQMAVECLQRSNDYKPL